MNESKCVLTILSKRWLTHLYCLFVFSLSNLQISKRTHHPTTDVTTSLCPASVPCAIPATVTQKHGQSAYPCPPWFTERFPDVCHVSVWHSGYRRKCGNTCFVPEIQLPVAVTVVAHWSVVSRLTANTIRSLDGSPGRPSLPRPPRVRARHPTCLPPFALTQPPGSPCCFRNASGTLLPEACRLSGLSAPTWLLASLCSDFCRCQLIMRALPRPPFISWIPSLPPHPSHSFPSAHSCTCSGPSGECDLQAATGLLWCLLCYWHFGAAGPVGGSQEVLAEWTRGWNVCSGVLVSLSSPNSWLEHF